MSDISNALIYGTPEEARRLIETGSPVNAQDQFGFTPLIEAILYHQIDIAELLLQYGASVDSVDITGATALSWAVEHSNVDLCKLLLKYGANPNHYTADGQPVLAKPLLRSQNELLDLLVHSGANPIFGLDYIQAKILGHRFELVQKADVIGPKGEFVTLSFEGFYLEFTLNLLFRSLGSFSQEILAKKPQLQPLVRKILRALQNANLMMAHKYFLDSQQAEKIIPEDLKKLFNEPLVIAPVSYDGHAITFVKWGNLLAKCDRGVNSLTDTVTLYQAQNAVALNPEFLADLVFTAHSDEYIQKDIKQMLNLNAVATLPAQEQVAGNCSWANVEAAIPAMLLILSVQGKFHDRVAVARAKKQAMDFYQEWIEWDKDRVLDNALKDFLHSKGLRRRCKAEILCAILAQRCHADKPRDAKRAEKILDSLNDIEKHTVLKTFWQVYGSSQSGEIGENFRKLLKLAPNGIDL